MAQKRILQTDISDLEAKKPRADVEKAPEPSWKEWLGGVYSKYWYSVICIFADVSIALEIGKALSNPWSYFIPLIVGFLLLLIEWRLYLKIWGRHRKVEPKED